MARRAVRGGPLVVVIDAPTPKAQIERIRGLAPDIEVIEGLSKESLARANVIYTNSAPFDPADAPALRWVQVDTAAVNQLAGTTLASTDIPVANVRGAYTPAVAEFTLALLLTLTRRLRRCSALQAQAKWEEDYPKVQGENCYGKTMGIVGYGNIGRHLARIAQAMGMNILACKKNPEVRKDTSYQTPNTGDPKGVIPSAWFGIDQLDRMFADCDFAVVALPLTPETKGLIGRKQLEALRPHAYVVNVGRGGVVDEKALADLLAAGRLAGAALDVFANEPLEPESPLWKLDNVILAPHIGSYTRDQNHFAAEILIENLTRELVKKPLVNIVDLKRGY